MTNEEKALYLTNAAVPMFDALVDIAEWKEEQMINKTCEWLKSQSCCGYIEDMQVDKFIREYKKAMKE